MIGSYRFDDPDGRVGMEIHIVDAGGQLMQVPLTYRDEPLDGAQDAFITDSAMSSSLVGVIVERWKMATAKHRKTAARRGRSL